MAAAAQQPAVTTTGMTSTEAPLPRIELSAKLTAIMQDLENTASDNIFTESLQIAGGPFGRNPLPGGIGRALTEAAGVTRFGPLRQVVQTLAIPRVPASRRFSPLAMAPGRLTDEQAIGAAAVCPTANALGCAEAGARYVLIMTESVEQAHVADPTQPLVMGLTQAAQDWLAGKSTGEVAAQLFAIGIPVLGMLSMRPAVTGVSLGMRRQVADIAAQLGYNGPEVTEQEFNNVLAAYVRNIDVIPLVRALGSLTVTSNPAVTAFFRRYGAGASHINAIATAVYVAPRLRAWGLISREEWDRFGDAVLSLRNDPLFLHPAQRGDPTRTAPYRATGMPNLTFIALVVLPYLGHTTWLDYNNKPFVGFLGGMTARSVEEEVIRELASQMAAAKARYLAAETRAPEELVSDAFGQGLVAHVQAPNRVQKRGGRLQQAGAGTERYTYTDRGGLNVGRMQT